MRKLVISAIILSLSLAPAANAQTTRALSSPVSGYTYFNRPGATLADEQAALEDCHSMIRGLIQPMVPAGGTPGVFQFVEQHERTKHTVFGNYEDCMVVRGWRVVRLSDTVGAELEALSQSALAERLAPLVGADPPSADIARTFHNDIAQAVAIRAADPFSLYRHINIPLAFRALPSTSPAAIPPQHPRPPGSMSSWTPEQMNQHAAELRVAQQEDRAQNEIISRTVPLLTGTRAARRTNSRSVSTPSPGSAVIVVRLTDNARGGGISLVRIGANDRQPDVISAAIPPPLLIGGRLRNDTFAYEIPPGHWRLTAFTTNAPMLGAVTSLCLGAPAFDIAAGDVLFAGTFAFGSGGPPLDLSLELGRTALAATPDLEARLQPVSYTNGETFECGAAAYFYAYEVDGAPFTDGYAWGSRANAASRVN